MEVADWEEREEGVCPRCGHELWPVYEGYRDWARYCPRCYGEHCERLQRFEEEQQRLAWLRTPPEVSNRADS